MSAVRIVQLSLMATSLSPSSLLTALHNMGSRAFYQDCEIMLQTAGISRKGLKAGQRCFSTSQMQQQEHHKQADQFAGKEFHQSPDKVDAKAQVIFDTCWRRLEGKLNQVISQISRSLSHYARYRQSIAHNFT